MKPSDSFLQCTCIYVMVRSSYQKELVGLKPARFLTLKRCFFAMCFMRLRSVKGGTYFECFTISIILRSVGFLSVKELIVPLLCNCS